MKVNDFTWRVGGEAGFGILSAGSLFAKSCQRAGLYAYASSEYPSLIRGGHNFLHVRISEKPIGAPRKHINLLVALNDETIEMHKGLVTKDGCILYDSNKIPNKDIKGTNVCPIPMADIAKEIQAPDIVRNTIGIGATFGMLDFDLQALKDILTEQFSKKGEKIVEMNHKAAQAGFDFVKKNFKGNFAYRLEKRGKKDTILINGNDAIGIGAVKAGVNFYAAYPMTPASSILNFMAKNDEKYNIMVKQTEDELAAMNMIIGASFAGARSMTASSGGGFALMTEALSMAGMLETPIVAVEAMRPGPSTGMPTRTDQGDLRFILHAGHGEFDKVVICPGDAEECFYHGFDAFNIAEHFQVPVLIVTDKYLADCLATVPPFKTEGLKIDRGRLLSDDEAKKFFVDGRFKRCDFSSPNGIPPRSIPGQKFGVHRATTDEHDEFGDLTNDEPADDRITQVKRRFAKLAKGVDAIKGLNNTDFVNVFTNFKGKPEQADVCLVSWGSTKGIILETMDILAKDLKIAFLQILYVSPFPEKRVSEFLDKSKFTVNVETNYTSQMAGVIREKTGKEIKHHINRFDGRPFIADELAEDILEITKKKKVK